MRILITAGPTREYIDPVRYISNASSGKMGYALARTALKAGHKVILISGTVSLRPPKDAKVINVQSAAEMFTAVKKNFSKCDCLIMAAAVADYTPQKPAKMKIKKTKTTRLLELKPTTDILTWAGKNKTRQIVAGFALEDRNIKANAERKLKEKKLDMIVANSPAAINTEKSTAYIKTPNIDWIKLSNSTKAAISTRIIKLLNTLA